MKKFLTAVFCLFAFAAYAQTGSVKTKAQITTEVNTDFADNTIGAITPFIVRQVILDAITSYMDLNGVSSFACAASNWVSGVSTTSQTCTQPGFANLSGNIATGQIANGTNANSTTFLRGDNTWAIVSGGSGSVTGQVATGAATNFAYYPSTGTVVSGTNFLVTTGNGVQAANATIINLRATQVTATTIFSQSLNTPNVVDVTYYGAVGDGSHDDTANIQAAINALPAAGGTVLFPPKNYKISSTLTIGAGTTTQVSLRQGVILQGVNNPGTGNSLFPYTVTAGAKLTWAGGGNPMIAILGPLSGWGVQNLYLDGNAGAASVCIAPTSAQNGDNRNLVLVNCQQGIGSSSHPLGGYSGINDVDSWQNVWTNTTVIVPGTSGGNYGIVLTGASDGSSDTDENVFIGTQVLVGGSNVGIVLQVADGNHFYGTRVISSNNTPGALEFDYSVNNVFPNGNSFYSIDWGILPGQLTVFNNGSPGTTTPNVIFDVEAQNGGTTQPLPNLLYISQDILAGSLGIASGSHFGGTITQTGSASAPVTINKISGEITTFNGGRVAGSPVIFTVNDSLVAATDTIIVNQGAAGGGTSGGYIFYVGAVVGGAFSVVVYPVVTESAAPVVNFQVLHGAAN